MKTSELINPTVGVMTRLFVWDRSLQLYRFSYSVWGNYSLVDRRLFVFVRHRFQRNYFLKRRLFVGLSMSDESVSSERMIPDYTNAV
jgi:hypothetical protein